MENVKEELGNEEEKTFHINTKTVCFLCLKKCHSVSPLTSYETFGNVLGELGDKHNLRQIFRHLKLDTKKIFSEVSPDSPLSKATKPLSTMADFEVFLCMCCVEVVRRLSSLCLELEFLQMKVDHGLETLQEVLHSNGNAIPLLVEVEDDGNGKLISPHGLDLVHAVVADVLREKTKELCSLKLKSSLPENDSSTLKTQLPNIKIESVSSLTNPSSPKSSTENVTSHASLNAAQAFEDFPATPTMGSLLFEEDGVTPTDSRLSESEMLQVTSFRLPLMTDVPQERGINNLVTCSLCPASANSIFGKEVLFHRHVICCHLDFLFVCIKDPRFSMAQFKAYCEYLMELQISSCSQGDGKKKRNSDDTPGFVCHICGDIFHEVKVFVGHMIQSHYEFFAMKLIHLQKSHRVTPEVLMNRKRSDIFIIEGPRYKCDDCGRVFVVPSSLYRHKRTPCQKPNGNDSLVGEDRPFICGHCGLSFKSASGRKYHIKRIHFGIDHNRDRVSCELCGKTMSKSSVGRHKNVSCRFRKMKTKSLKHKRVNETETNIAKEKLEGSGHKQMDFDDVSYYLTEKLEIEVTEVDQEEDEDVSPIIVCTTSVGNKRAMSKSNHHRTYQRMLECDDMQEEEETEAYAIDEEEEEDDGMLYEFQREDPLRIK